LRALPFRPRAERAAPERSHSRNSRPGPLWLTNPRPGAYSWGFRPLMMRAGDPATTQSDRTSRVTMAPATTTTLSPSVTAGQVTACPPSQQLWPNSEPLTRSWASTGAWPCGAPRGGRRLEMTTGDAQPERAAWRRSAVAGRILTQRSLSQGAQKQGSRQRCPRYDRGFGEPCRGRRSSANVPDAARENLWRLAVEAHAGLGTTGPVNVAGSRPRGPNSRASPRPSRADRTPPSLI